MLLATDLADYLVKNGVPFRQAHEVIGKLTAFSLAQERGFPELSLEEFRQFSELFDRDLFAVLDTKSALKARQAMGAPSFVNVAAELKRWQKGARAGDAEAVRHFPTDSGKPGMGIVA